ncbi:CHAP domain-containing protein [Azospirillum picis]|uniref:Peptidase C51 domain-containing protein n=1 Tax=Azospirillum picis TaxID=488438 RepID=A0ABU0MF14_9PROT|nr:CHAP domain-containing protein [Azospirillum picis]MBP2298175.1 hypothetical protein [Azospirillum picis]MDQ0532013.1 hypothetical protein [Azospirillum picis]
MRTVRSLSDFTIRGDAWTWWDHAAGRYDREHRPSIGSVLVFKRTGIMRRGHVSLVSAVIDRRTIEVDHTWIAGDGLQRGMRVVDVSKNNDWSSVRVWHEPTDQLGLRVYAAYGFIMPEDGDESESRENRMLDAGDRGMDHGFSSAPRGRGKAGDGPRIVEASLHPQKGVTVSARNRGKSHSATVVASHAPQRPQRTDVAVLPSRKPGASHAAPAATTEVAALPTIRHGAPPSRKPGAGNSVAQLADRNER